MNTASPITALKGVGEKTAALFHRVGVDTVGELLSYYPRTYDVYEKPKNFADLEPDRVQAVTAMLHRTPEGKKAGRYHITTVSAYRERNPPQSVLVQYAVSAQQPAAGADLYFPGPGTEEKGTAFHGSAGDLHAGGL